MDDMTQGSASANVLDGDPHADESDKIYFGDFALDLSAGSLTRAGENIALKPKAYALLAYLVKQAGRLISKDELLQAVWPRGFVCDSVLKVSIREIRQVLGEDSEHPRWLFTVHRRGYRFVLDRSSCAWQKSVPLTTSKEQQQREEACVPLQSPLFGSAHLVGRDADLARLQREMHRALSGDARLTFVYGEAGIGKSSFLEVCAREASALQFRLLRYRCRPRKTRMAVCEPLTAMIRSACDWTAPENLTLLLLHAPSWVQVLAPGKRPGRHHAGNSAQEEPIISEWLALMVALAKQQPIMLAVDDLQWASPCLIDAIVEFAHLNTGARILWVGAEQSGNTDDEALPIAAVRADLEWHQDCTIIKLGRLAETDVQQFVARTLGCEGHALAWGHVLYEVCDGHPWLMVAAWQYWSETARLPVGSIIGPSLTSCLSDFPPNVRHYLLGQWESLTTAEQTVIEAASVCQQRVFSAACVATILADQAVSVESVCEYLSRKHGLIRRILGHHASERRCASRYEFVHPLFPRLLLQEIPSARQALYKQRLAARGR